MKNKDNELPKKEDLSDLSDLFDEIDAGLDRGTASESTPPGDFEGQFKETPSHGDTTLFDKQDYWDRKLQWQMEDIVTECNRIGIPMQACALLARTVSGYSLRHFQTKLETDETKAAGMIYRIPHGVAHMVLFNTSFPFQMVGGNYQRGTPHFNHLSQFEDEIIPKVSVLKGACELIQIPFQIGFVPKQTEEEVETRGAICGVVGCEFVAAFKLYDAMPPVIEAVIDIFTDLHGPQEVK